MGGTPSGARTNFSTSLAVTYIGNATTTANSTSYNWGNFVTASDGVVVVIPFLIGATSQTFATCTIGGTSATIWDQATSSTTKRAICSVFKAAGTHAVVTDLTGANGTTPSGAVGVWLITGYISASPVCTSVNATGAPGTGAGCWVNFDLPPGCGYCSAVQHSSAENTTWTNSGGLTVTEDFDTSPAASRQYSGAHGINNGSAYLIGGGSSSGEVGDIGTSWASSVANAQVGGVWT